MSPNNQQPAVVQEQPVVLPVGVEGVRSRQDSCFGLDPAYDAGECTTEEMNLLADELDEIISRKEAHEH